MGCAWSALSEAREKGARRGAPGGVAVGGRVAVRDVEAAARALAGGRPREARARRPVVLPAVVPPSRAEARREHVLRQLTHCELQAPCGQTQNDVYSSLESG